jgi:hypothetical protein
LGVVLQNHGKLQHGQTILELNLKIYIENPYVYGINEQLLSKIKLMEGMLDFKESLSEFDNFSTHHPSQQTHYNFVKKYFSEFLGEKSLDLLNNDYNQKYREYIDKIIPDYHGLGLYDKKIRVNFCFGYF